MKSALGDVRKGRSHRSVFIETSAASQLPCFCFPFKHVGGTTKRQLQLEAETKCAAEGCKHRAKCTAFLISSLQTAVQNKIKKKNTTLDTFEANKRHNWPQLIDLRIAGDGSRSQPPRGSGTSIPPTPSGKLKKDFPCLLPRGIKPAHSLD